jgi:nucleotide-binding universal stress UspA family protein
MSYKWFALAALALLPTLVSAGEISGKYLETRTCQVYTGPCFANSETAMAGREAVMAWNIEEGKRGEIDLAGLSVVLVVRADDTLGHQGLNDPKTVRSAIIVDEKATAQQRAALVEFAKDHAGRAGKDVVRVDAAPISMSLDTADLRGNLAAGEIVKLTTRKAKATDCICTNEVAYYPPLAKVDRFAAGVSIEAEYNGKGLGTRWSTPGSRSAYMGEFVYE